MGIDLYCGCPFIPATSVQAPAFTGEALFSPVLFDTGYTTYASNAIGANVAYMYPFQVTAPYQVYFCGLGDFAGGWDTFPFTTNAAIQNTTYILQRLKQGLDYKQMRVKRFIFVNNDGNIDFSQVQLNYQKTKSVLTDLGGGFNWIGDADTMETFNPVAVGVGFAEFTFDTLPTDAFNWFRLTGMTLNGVGGGASSPDLSCGFTAVL